jgi:hypothetical protein
MPCGTTATLVCSLHFRVVFTKCLLNSTMIRWVVAEISICRVPFAIGVFSPSGYIDTLYLDEDLRISKGEQAGSAVQ